jgi:hypothetical protein
LLECLRGEMFMPCSHVQLEVSDVPETRKAVQELLQQLQTQPTAGGNQATEASGSGSGLDATEGGAGRPGFGPVADAASATSMGGAR